MVDRLFVRRHGIYSRDPLAQQSQKAAVSAQLVIPNVEPVIVKGDELAKFDREGQFIEVAFNLLREVTSYVCIAGSILGTEPTWDRDRAIVGGNLVRLFKLLSAFLDQTAQRKREITDILARLCFETAVNLRFLLKDLTPDSFQSYMRYSLRHERKLSDRIHENVEKRGGQRLPIEERMLHSLKRTADRSGVDLCDVDLTQKGPWAGKHLRQKAAEVGWNEPYEAMFGGLSHFVHGSWQDLLSHHLKAVSDDRFEPAFDWSHPRPQPLFALAYLAIDVIFEGVQFLGGEPAVAEIEPKLQSLVERIEIADQFHEAYLSRDS